MKKQLWLCKSEDKYFNIVVVGSFVLQCGCGFAEHSYSISPLFCCWGTQAEKENNNNFKLTLLNINEISQGKEKTSLA